MDCEQVRDKKEGRRMKEIQAVSNGEIADQCMPSLRGCASNPTQGI